MDRPIKGLVLSGGKGARLRPITFTRTKQLIPVANRPILFYGIEDLKGAGIRDIGIVTGRNSEEIKDVVGDGSVFGVKVTYIEQEEPLGIAHAVGISRKFIGGSPFVLYLGDNLLKGGIALYTEMFRKGGNLILLSEVGNPSLFGVASLRHGRVVRLVEKPSAPPSNLALVGIYMFREEIFEAISTLTPSSRGEYEITEAIQYLIDGGYEVKHDIVSGWWKDTGGISDLFEANRLVLEDMDGRVEGRVVHSTLGAKVVVEKGAEVKESEVKGPAIIGEGAAIEDSLIGPFTSISRACRILRSRVENSIIMDHSLIEGMGMVKDSLIGRNVEIRINRAGSTPLRLILGDNSSLKDIEGGGL